MRLKKFLSTCLAVFILSSSIFCSACSSNSNEDKIKISWIDTDGSLIETTYIEEKDDFREKKLPADTETWHYTDWKIVYSENLIICVAQRVEKITYIWKDIDGSIIKEHDGYYGENIDNPETPPSTEKWIYTGWNKTVVNNIHTLTLQRSPNEEYFLANVFQIIVYDEKGEPVSSGSGFIIDENGWFITNNHVMSDSISANAFFDIPDSETGQDYTKLSVFGGIYNSEEDDIFIGKLNNYEKLENQYNEIVFNENYIIGENTYSIGYPNSSLYMQINKGTLLQEYKDIYGKIYDNYYILSDSYIAPGSSGGILINENLEVIGITSMGLYADSNKTVYVAGGSIPTKFFLNEIKNLEISNIKLLTEMY